MTTPITTGADLKAARTKLGLTQAQLAERFGFGAVHGRNTIARLEQSDRIHNHYRLATDALLEGQKNGE